MPREAASPRRAPIGAVREEQVRLLFRFSLVGYLATLLVVFILGAVLWEELARPALFAWFAAISVITVGRYALYKLFINRDPAARRSCGAWERRFLVGSFLTALCWAAIATFLLPDSAHLAQRLTVVMLVTLLVTGAVGYYAPHPYAFKITRLRGPGALRAVAGLLGRPRPDVPLRGDPRCSRACCPTCTTSSTARWSTRSPRARTRTRSRASSRSSARALQQANDALAEEMVERLKAQQARAASPPRSCACTSSARRSR